MLNNETVPASHHQYIAPLIGPQRAFSCSYSLATYLILPKISSVLRGRDKINHFQSKPGQSIVLQWRTQQFNLSDTQLVENLGT